MTVLTIRGRFAPSPTGYLHLGNMRTAIFAWLYVKHHHGKFVLRIEDTDQERSTQAAIQVILDGMKWLGLDYDEGPFYQSKRLDRYHEVAEKFIAAGKAYRCYCSKERLSALREQQLANKEKPRYDGHCRDRAPQPTGDGQPYVIRFKNPHNGTVAFKDEVNGTITFNNAELDDLIIIRTDNYPTYNFCVVVDDMDMAITHVIRGADHINNTPRQINIFNALNATPPTYAHVPLILGTDGKLLAKRHGAVSVLQYRDEGFLPEAMLNYFVRLGWSHGDKEIFSREEMIELFDCKDINKSPAAINPEKLLWLNRHYMKTLDPQLIAARLKDFMPAQNLSPADLAAGPDLVEIVQAQCERCETLCEMAAKSRFFYADITHYEEQATKHLSGDALAILRVVMQRFGEFADNDWIKENLHQTIENIATQFATKLGKIAQPIRVALSGTTISPPIDITLQILGKCKSLERINNAIKFIENK